MISTVLVLLSLFFILLKSTSSAPTLYEYYTSDGISSGLSVENPYFTLNGKNITIYSGAMHYFRIPRQYWRDRLKKLRAAGLNTIETYIAWNLHEPQNGLFDFGDGGSEFEDFLNLEEFLTTAQEEDLFVIVRPGPYICAEFEWGGLPSWLLREEGLQIRRNEATFMKYVRRYFKKLLPILAKLQFTQGGPIIAFQIENEYGFYSGDKDKTYLQALVDLHLDNDITELLLSSDGPGSGTSGSLPGIIFQTLNFGSDPEGAFEQLEQFQPGKPRMVMEFYPGWFDHWGEAHHTTSNENFHDTYSRIINYPASVNLYMFHGGTNFAFLNGANLDNGFLITTTSYDYDAPLTESGNYTEKYFILQKLLEEVNIDGILTPEMPQVKGTVAYNSIKIEAQLSYNDILDQALFTQMSNEPLVFELLNVNNNSGQSYGYIVYRKENIDIPAGAILKIDNTVHDSCIVMINGERVSPNFDNIADLDGFGYWKASNAEFTLTDQDLTGATLDLLVTNWGRVNFGGIDNEIKGLRTDNVVSINGEEILLWLNIPLELKKSWNNGLTGWSSVSSEENLIAGPALYKAILNIEGEPSDTFINMEEWSMGFVMVNGFVLGRYFEVGPQQALYLPAPFLKSGDNEIVVFEHFKPKLDIIFSEQQIYAN